MHAMILAAGRGERMRPLTDTQPKPLLKVGGKTLIEWHIHRLAQAGITRLVINHAWLGSLIENALGDGRRYNVHITYSREATPLETAGGIAQALPMLGSAPFLVLNGDVWCDWNPAQAGSIAKLLTSHKLQAWLLLADNPAHHPDGDFSLDKNQFVHKPAAGGDYTFTGIGVYDPALFDTIDIGQPAALGPLLYQASKNNLVTGQHHQSQWIDVGTPQRLAELDALLS